MYIISLFPHLHTPFSPSLISLMVSVDVKHHVYYLLLIFSTTHPVSVVHPYMNLKTTEWSTKQVCLFGYIKVWFWCQTVDGMHMFSALKFVYKSFMIKSTKKISNWTECTHTQTEATHICQFVSFILLGLSLQKSVSLVSQGGQNRGQAGRHTSTQYA